jgi:ABC-type sugar transport system permease subunit
MGKIITTLITVVVAVAASAGLWIGANLVFNQVRNKWRLFSTIVFGVMGFVVGVLLAGNRAIAGSVAGEDDGALAKFGQWVWFPLILGAAAAVIGMLLSSAEDRTPRLLIGVGGMGALGVLSGLLVRSEVRPDIEPVALVAFTAVVAAIGAGLSVLRSRPPLHGALLGGAVGWLLGAWGAPDLGDGPAGWPAVALAVPAALVGARIALGSNPELVQRGVIDQKSRAYIFLGPAMLFIFIALVVPAIRTGYLSLLDRDSVEWVGLQNYVDTFQDKNSFDGSGFSNLFGSRLFYIGLALLAIGGFIGSRSKQLTGRFVELGSPSSFPLLGAFVFLCFALFTVLRGTLINNLWWVVVVVIFSTGLGLAVAVLADNVKGEKFAKSIIFMPMAISLVGATIIWRFMYLPRDTSVDQTGLMNAAWVGLGRLSTGSGIPTYIVGALAVLLLLGLLVVVARSLTRRSYGRAVVPGILVLLVGWFTIRYFSSGGVGGVVPNDDGTFSPDTINFIQESPFNNVWLMIVFIWIQTGFAMVILSAAIKAVPEELLEAARVDGATRSQVFWRVTLPQISSTIVVIVTTLIVGVMKVFDIVKVMTNGQFDTQVLANDMFNQSFSFLNTGRGAALAMLIFFSVLPVMVYNIRQLQKEA